MDTPESSIQATILVGFICKLHMGQLISLIQLQEYFFKAVSSLLVIHGVIAAHARGLALPSVREQVAYRSLGGNPPYGLLAHRLDTSC